MQRDETNAQRFVREHKEYKKKPKYAPGTKKTASCTANLKLNERLRIGRHVDDQSVRCSRRKHQGNSSAA
jgi:hypothetical protein